MKIKALFVAALFLMTLGLGTAQAEDSALDQLQGMQNTGVTFDGSDGERSGMDTWVTPSSGSIPDVPEPTPVEPVQDYSVSQTTTTEDYSQPEPPSAETSSYDNSSSSSTDTSNYSAPASEPVEEQGPSTGEEVA